LRARDCAPLAILPASILVIGLAGCQSGLISQQEDLATQADCKRQGFVEGSDDYALCVAQDAAARAEMRQAGQASPPSPNGNSVYSQGQPVYNPNECTGPIVMRECQGQIVPEAAYHPRCYGQMLYGAYTGPMF
jgi:hypothetical protein